MAATDYDFILTRNELIQLAFEKVGAISDGEVLSAEQIDKGVKLINGILKAWNNDGVMLWTELRETVTTVDGTDDYAIPTANGMAYVDKAYRVENGRELELERLDVNQGKDIERKADEGKPEAFYVDHPANKVVFWPVPNAVFTIYLDGVRKLKDWESASSTGDLPARWQSAIKYALVVELSEDYILPIREREYFLARAQTEYMKARAGERDPADNSFVRGAY